MEGTFNSLWLPPDTETGEELMYRHQLHHIDRFSRAKKMPEAADELEKANEIKDALCELFGEFGK